MIVVGGEALFDVFGGADTSHGVALDAVAGGSPFNVAIGLARLRQPVCFLSHVSHDFLGQRLMRVLQAEGVDTRAVQRSDAPTTLSVVGRDEQGKPAYAFYGQGCADRLLSADALDRLPPVIDALVLGSYAAVVGQTAITQRQLVDRLHARTLIAYDPNIRLNVEPDLALWREQIRWMLPRTHLLKVSDEDLELVHPALSPQRFAHDALAQGVACVVVTRGAKGAQAWTGQAQAVAAPVPVQVVDTVGAGDTFMAAWLCWLAEHAALKPTALAQLSSEALNQALAFAAAAAAITCSRRGADLPRRGELP